MAAAPQARARRATFSGKVVRTKGLIDSVHDGLSVRPAPRPRMTERRGCHRGPRRPGLPRGRTPHSHSRRAHGASVAVRPFAPRAVVPIYWRHGAFQSMTSVVGQPSPTHSSMLNDVYNTRILELAGNIPRIGRLSAPDASATAHSKLCGSTVTVDLKMEGDTVTDFAHEVKACALGPGILVDHGAQRRRLARRGAARRCARPCGACSRRTAARRRASGTTSGFWSRCATTRRATPRRLLTFDAVVSAIDAIDAKRRGADSDARTVIPAKAGTQ